MARKFSIKTEIRSEFGIIMPKNFEQIKKEFVQ